MFAALHSQVPSSFLLVLNYTLLQKLLLKPSRSYDVVAFLDPIDDSLGLLA